MIKVELHNKSTVAEHESTGILTVILDATIKIIVMYACKHRPVKLQMKLNNIKKQQ
jgi:hypothetical protein